MKRFVPALLFVLLSILLPGGMSGAEPPSETPPGLTLEEAVRMALMQNSDIRMAKSSVAAAREAARSASADLLAKFETGYSVSRLSDDPEVIFGGTQVFIAGSKPNYRWTVGFSQPLFTGFALTTARELAELGVDTAVFQKDATEEEIILRTKAAYFQRLLAARLKAVAEEAVHRLRAHLKDAQAMYDAGAIPKNDLLKSNVQLAEAAQDLVRAENRLEMTRSQLNLLLKRGINAETRLMDVLTWTPYTRSLADSLEQGLNQRPEIHAMEVAVEQAAKEVRLERSRYYPNLAMVGEYYRQGDTLDVNGNGFTNSKNAAIGLEAKWTFFEWGKTGAEVNRALYEKERAVEGSQRLQDSVSLQIKQAWLDLQTAEKNIDTARTALEQARENFRITDLQYKEQMTTSTEVLDAETLLTQAETHYYGALYGYNLALASLERAMGTGRP